MKKIVVSSKFIKSETVTSPDGSTTSTVNTYLHTTADGVTFFSNEPLMGQAVSLTPKKAGDKYVKTDGTEGVVKKDGFLFDGTLGNAASIRSSIEAASALTELNAFKF